MGRDAKSGIGHGLDAVGAAWDDGPYRDSPVTRKGEGIKDALTHVLLCMFLFLSLACSGLGRGLLETAIQLDSR